MNLPAAIEVGPLTYTVGEMRSDETWGSTDHTTLVMLIESQQADDRKRGTLLHEVLHALVYVTDLDIDLDPETEEIVVSRLSPALLGVLRDNPALVAYLTAP